jgi:hypothetical protein
MLLQEIFSSFLTHYFCGEHVDSVHVRILLKTFSSERAVVRA